MRANAAKLGIDPDRIVAAGGSAGGHIAACTAFTPGLDAGNEDAQISSKPNALVLFNPVLRFADIPQLMERLGDDEALGKAISPTLHLTKHSPPTLIFFGTADRLAVMGDEFMKKSKELEHRADLFTAEGQPHGFFNRPPWQERTTQRMDEFLVSIGYLPAQTTGKNAPRIDITSRKSGDRIEVEAEDGNIVLTVTSPSGIGSATVTPEDGKWPSKLVLRLRLKGLESLTISHEQVTLVASFSSHGDSQHRVYVKAGGQETPLDKDDPYWMEIEMVGGKAVPLQSGHFEVVLPAAIFKSQPKTVTISWIDFYRG
jgi:dipeptidyl aminopeptidase/acylaminoacyl peptidase